MTTSRLAASAAAVSVLLFCASTSPASSLRFHGNGVDAPDLDRVKIPVDDVATTMPGPPADIGSGDFTIEFRMKAAAADNTAAAVTCGSNLAWINGNIVVDRDRYNQGRKFGLSIAGGRFVFGVSTTSEDRTICGATAVLDGAWHHVAVTRSAATGEMAIWIDGVLDASATGPAGDISYPDDGVPCSNCCGGSSCNFSDPYIVLGAEKHDAGASYPSYSGFLDELRLSDVVRYVAPFSPPAAAFAPDGDTVALYHFDEGSGDLIGDSSGHPGGPSDGERRFGGSPAGPEWSAETPFGDPSDLDGDGKPNSADECTVLLSSQRFARSKIDLKGLDLSAGSQSMSWKGEFRPDAGALVDPSLEGLHLRLADGGGLLVDVDLPAGLAGASPSAPCDSRDGWTLTGSPTSPTWLYRNYSGYLDAACSSSAQGISLVKLRDQTNAERPLLRFQVKASGSNFVAAMPASLLEATLGLEARDAAPAASAAAQSGACGDFAWDPVTLTRPLPYCKATSSRLLCRTP